MHLEARLFMDYCFKYFNAFFKGRALDVGSGDINGNNRRYFAKAREYIGCDVFPGRNVNVVSKCHELPFDDEEFDLIISSECFEHDAFYEKSILKIIRMLKTGGLFVFSCASTGRGEHGTRRTNPACSFTTHIQDEIWADYYKNLTEKDVLKIEGFANAFPYHRFYYNPKSKDLYFVGIKKTTNVPYIPDYSADLKIDTPCFVDRKTVVVYAYHDLNTNVKFFADHGVFESTSVDFVFVCNGDSRLNLPNANVSEINRHNIGMDFGGWSDAIFGLNLRDRYDHFILVNSTVRGPFLPPWCPVKDWTGLFTRLIDFETKLVGTTIGIVEGDAVIQSVVLAFDRTGLDIGIEEGIFAPNLNKSKSDLIWQHEVKFSRSVLQRGYKIRPLMSAYFNTDLTEKLSSEVHVRDYCTTNNYFGVNIHPYEIIFIRDNRNINNNSDIEAVSLHHNNRFSVIPKKDADANIPPDFNWKEYLIMNLDVASGIPITERDAIISWMSYGYRQGREYKLPKEEYKSRIPDDFEWKEYLSINRDVAKVYPTRQGAIDHWLNYGINEGRSYTSKSPNTASNVTVPPDFDWKDYLLMNKDLLAMYSTEREAVQHWQKVGYKENRKYKLGQ